MQVESLQEQLQAMMTKRDEALARLDVAQHQVHQYASSLKNLHGVLEKFQRGKVPPTFMTAFDRLVYFLTFAFK